MAVSLHGICAEAVLKGILPCLYGMGREVMERAFYLLIPVCYRVKKKRGIIPCQTKNINKNAA